MGFVLGFIAGVVGGPLFMAKAWPHIKAWWDSQTID